ncbi:MarR family winged helix-turn-helix transcriptional regulator [Streptomyces sp. NL15-2K]|uniref:MarR family winged helix-turn-helix transcriptional regulator n=1 Tax=Streptomyces sp. NL15-2K TaxID=376149 RepID=UPI000F572637|nr:MULTISPECIES: MarR family transcriptional regulator [Actinomycetes]WKX12332.1 MarR family transcriptional regulator [Kutzneria buriramensis]GCB46165.1 marR family transcriptional regulator [Streptomyces sp. NL15-2K]
MGPSREELLAELGEAGRVHSNAAVMYHAAISARMGLSAVEEKTLDLLQRSGALSAGELGELTGLAPASVSGLIDRLERKGFARRVKDPKDRRRVNVEIDPATNARFAPLFAPFAAQLADLYAEHSDAELALILDFLHRSAQIQREATRALTEQE